MSRPLPRAEEKLLRSVIVGELDATSEAVQAARSESPALARALEEYEALCSELNAQALPLERVLELASSDRRGADAALVRAVLERERRRRRLAAREGLPRWLKAAAAALLAAAVGLASFHLMSGPERPTALLGESLCRSPVGAVETYAPFELDLELGPRGTVRFFVYDVRGRELLASPALSSPRWQPESKALATLDREPRLRWSYSVRDASGEEVRAGDCEAWRSP